ncbi:glycosyltransferase [Lentzea sp. NPDC058436]|uniref:glycosyltransferase n=1 Tax=Lentzea sp. NPDC058436 TaxID=3346499 RepID=UPI003664BCE9
MIFLATVLAVVAACCFAAAVHLQHRTVRSTKASRVMFDPRWLAGGALAAMGAGLHVAALTLAPVTVVQPIGVLSLVVTAFVTRRARRAALVVAAATTGFVLLSATNTPPTAVTNLLLVDLIAITAAALGLAAGRGRCLVSASAAAVLFGLGSTLVRAASVTGSLALAAQAVLLVAVGALLVHQAYAAGSTATVIAATTVIDPMTAVLAGFGVLGEVTPPLIASAQVLAGLVAAAGVLAVARAGDERAELGIRQPGPLRVLIAADTFPPDVNGAATFAARLAAGLAERDVEVHVVCPSTSRVSGADLFGAVQVHRVTSTRTPFHRTFRVCTPWRVRAELPAILAAADPDVVHVQAHFGVGRTVLAMARERGLPVVATNHFMPENLLAHSTLPGWSQRAITELGWRDVTRVYRGATAVTAPTPRAAELLQRRGLAVRAVSCGIDLGHYASHREPRTGPMVVTFVGRLDREKNVDDLIRAVASTKDVRAEVVGDGTCRAEWEALAIRLRAPVTFHGYLSDDEMLAVLRRADVFCMPGTAELQSIATLEAMAAGLPVVAANAMALPHLVHPGENGDLYPPGDIAALAAALTALADPELRITAGRASRRIAGDHDLARTVDTFHTTYQGLTDIEENNRVPAGTAGEPRHGQPA